MEARRHGIKALAENAAIGWFAAQSLDWLSVVFYEGESAEEKKQENDARGGLQVYERAVQGTSRRMGHSLSAVEARSSGWILHKVFGIGIGLVYASLRRRNPKLGFGAGALFGSTFLLLDEVLAPLMKWSPGPRAFSWKVHARGVASHIAFGMAAESAVRMTERIERAQKSAA